MPICAAADAVGASILTGYDGQRILDWTRNRLVTIEKRYK
jgi:hypothetical protein